MSKEIQDDTQFDLILGRMSRALRNQALYYLPKLDDEDLAVLSDLYESCKDMPPNPYWDRSG